MNEILNEKRIDQLISKIDKSLFVNGPILPCTFEGHDDIVAIRAVLITFQTLARYGIVEFEDDGFAFKNIDLEKYEFDDNGFMKFPEVPEVENDR